MESTAERHREEVIGAYTSAVRLRLYARLSAFIGVVAAAGVVGAMIIGTAGVEPAMVALDAALILAIASAAKLYDASVRTSISASGLERGLGLDEDLYAEVPKAREKAKILTIVAAALCAVAAAGILSFAVTNQGTETDDDDDDRKTSVTEEKSESESDDD